MKLHKARVSIGYVALVIVIFKEVRKGSTPLLSFGHQLREVIKFGGNKGKGGSVWKNGK